MTENLDFTVDILKVMLSKVYTFNFVQPMIINSNSTGLKLFVEETIKSHINGDFKDFNLIISKAAIFGNFNFKSENGDYSITFVFDLAEGILAEFNAVDKTDLPVDPETETVATPVSVLERRSTTVTAPSRGHKLDTPTMYVDENGLPVAEKKVVKGYRVEN